MLKIVIQNLNYKEIFVHNEEKTLLDTIHANNIDWMHACGKKGRCTTCKAIILKGEDNFTPFSAAEKKYLMSGKLTTGERLSCQCRVVGNVAIKIPNAYKFPHIEYTD